MKHTEGIITSKMSALEAQKKEKKSVLGFWHMPISIKLDPLTPKMGLFSWFGVPKAPKHAFEVYVCYLPAKSNPRIPGHVSLSLLAASDIESHKGEGSFSSDSWPGREIWKAET